MTRWGTLLRYGGALVLIALACGRALAQIPPGVPAGFVLVAQDDGGNPKAQTHLVAGKNWTSTDEEKRGLEIPDPRYLTVAYNDNAQPLVFRYTGLRPDARYVLRVHYYNIQHDRPLRVQTLAVDDAELHGPLQLPHGQPIVRTFTLAPALYRDAVITLTCRKTAGLNTIVSAIELWSDREGLLGPVGSFIRFRVDALPPGQAKLQVTAIMKIHASPWVTKSFTLTPADITAPGVTPWVDLRKQPGAANGSLILSVPAGAKGATQFGLVASDTAFIREIGWDEPDGTKIIVEPGLNDVRTFREQERRYYRNAVDAMGGKLYPLSRPPLLFSNAWGHTTGGAAEYMVKTFRLLGFNSVETITDQGKYEGLYGWGSQGGHYSPPGYQPYDDAATRAKFDAYYREYFGEKGRGAGSGPGLRVFQLADEPGEAGVPSTPEALAAFRAWIAARGATPELFGKTTWDEARLLLKDPKTPEDRRLFYWSRRYQAYLTPRRFALAADAVRAQGPNREVQSYVALSGHALYFPSKQPLDMFQLAQYPGLMPGISDWMTSGSWWWDSHQSVAFSVAPFNAGARRYGADFGTPPLSFPMMHAVYASPFRVYTQLANQCKLISYYTYGPDYESTEGFWSNVGWMYGAVGAINNRAALVDDILGPGTMRPSRIALLYTQAQEIWWPQGSFADKRAAFLALSHEYYQPELVTEQHVLDGALDHYDALYVLDQYVPEAVQERIAGWVKGGGLLWACADAACRNEYAEPYDLLERLDGIKRVYNKPGENGLQIVPVAGETEFAPHAVPGDARLSDVAWEGARVRARYGDNAPAWLEKTVGKGKVVFFGHRCGLSYARRASKRGPFANWPAVGREFFTQPLREAHISRELTLSTPLVMAQPISTAAGTVIVLYNMNAAAATNVTVSLKEPAKPFSVQTFNGFQLVNLPFAYADGAVRIEVAYIQGDGQMIVVRRAAPPVDDRLALMRRTAEESLASADWQALSAGAWFAGYFPEWKLAPKLVPLLKHEHWAVRRSAAEALGRLDYQPAARAIRDALEGETDTHALADELYALVQLKHRDAKKLCAKYREHADPFVRSEAGRAAALLDSLTQGK